MTAPKSPLLRLFTLALASVGVVYGDIGTSPLYAFREAVGAASQGGALAPEVVLGILSLIIWALIIVVTVKYVGVLLYADNHGEGGILALMALADKFVGRGSPAILVLGMLGAALFYGDAVITPAISVLSAVEGLKLTTSVLEPYVLPVATLILVGLFAVQSHGTAGLARYFAPFMTLWFIVIGMAGAVHILQEPRVLAAINPAHAASFMASHAMLGLVVLGAVFLAVTGVEALYADLGHFGRKPIQIAWLFLVFPALVLNYSGQAALLLVHPDAVDNPFYRLVPEALLMPMVLLATTATVIASQAVITGTYSLTRQAVQLGLLPKLEVRHTSEEESGQIYMPRVKGLMLIGVLLLVLMFQSSSKLASAYGIAVTGTMVVTSILAFFVIWKAWKWSMTAAAVLMAPLAAIDLIFLGSNLLKVTQGGWVALAVAGFVLLMMWTWRRGTKIITTTIRKQDVPLKKLVKDLEASPPTIVPGAAIYFVRRPHFAPAALLHSLKHFKVLHERVAVMTIHTVNAPRVAIEKAVEVERLSQHFWQIDLSCGFMQVPDLPKALASAHATGCKFDMMETSFIVSRVSIKPDGSSGMPLWQDHLFITLSRNEVDATEYFGIPHNRVVEVGLQLIV